MEFKDELRTARAVSGLTQAQVASTTGIARANIAAYETGTREPRYTTALRLLAAVSTRVVIEPPVGWSWTTGRRPYAVPTRLWRLPPHQALATITPDQHLWWSGPPRNFDLSQRPDRLRAYEIVLREGRPEDITPIVDEILLIEAWGDLVLPNDLRQAWNPLTTMTGHDPTASTA